MTNRPPPHPAPPLILASTSRYRRELLQRFGWPFEVMAPQVDETAQAQETPAALAQRLALAKAQAVAAQRPDAVVIGSDQVADLDGLALGKPGTHARAVTQLRMQSGKRVIFHTALAVVQVASGHQRCELASVTVDFRHLSDEEIDNYLRLEQPYDCAAATSAPSMEM